jgi:hypothetical protein
LAVATFNGAKLAVWKKNLAVPGHPDNALDVPVSWAKAGTAIDLEAYQDDTSLTGNPRAQLEHEDAGLVLGAEYWASFLFRYKQTYSSPGWNSPYETYGPPYAGSPPWAIGHKGTDISISDNNTNTILWRAPQADFSRATPRRITFHSLLHTDRRLGFLELYIDGIQQLLGGLSRWYFDTLDATNWDGHPQHYTLQVYHQSISTFPNPVGAQFGDFWAGPTREIVEPGTTTTPIPVDTTPLASTFAESFDGDGLANFPAERRVGATTVEAGLLKQRVSITAPYAQARSIDLRKFDGFAVVTEVELTPRVSSGTAEVESVYPTIGFKSTDGVEVDGNNRIVFDVREVGGVQRVELRLVEAGNDPAPYLIPVGSLPIPLEQIKAVKTVLDTDGQSVRWLVSSNRVNFQPVGISRKFSTFNFAGRIGYVELATAISAASAGAAASDSVVSNIFVTSQTAANPAGVVTPGDAWRSFGSNARITVAADSTLLTVNNAAGGLWLAFVGMRDAASGTDEWPVGIQAADATPGLSMRIGKAGDADAHYLEFVPGLTGSAAFGSPLVLWRPGVRGFGLVGCDAQGRLSTHFGNGETGEMVHANDFTTISIPAALSAATAKFVIGGPRASNTTDAWHGFGAAAFYGAGKPSNSQVEAMWAALS